MSNQFLGTRQLGKARKGLPSLWKYKIPDRVISLCLGAFPFFIYYTNTSTPHWRRFWRYDNDKRRIVHMDPKVVSAKRKKCLDAYRSDISLNIRASISISE